MQFLSLVLASARQGKEGPVQFSSLSFVEEHGAGDVDGSNPYMPMPMENTSGHYRL